ncbi:MAG: hypothetical protein WB647_10265 [Roseiarcus sp.]|uniref:hypothetical protein n=1 Tax=Roseiarcus sp. TaxID=1969460 RepID=UPI003C51E644
MRHAVRPLILCRAPTSPSAAAHPEAERPDAVSISGNRGGQLPGHSDNVRYPKARELLAVTDMPIGEIAHALSYAGHPPFIDAYPGAASHVGMAPRDP